MTQRPGRDDGPPPPGDGDLPQLPPEWGDVVVPDDASALAAEAEQVRAELRSAAGRIPRSPDGTPQAAHRSARSARRARRSGRGASGGGWPAGRQGLAVPLGALAVVMVAAFVSLVGLVMPGSPRSPRPAPLAASSAAPGRPGGLLPDVALVDPDGRPVRVRDLRPAVLLLIPPACGRCTGTAAEVVAASRDAAILVVLVGSGDRPPALPQPADRVRTRTLADPTGAVADGVPASSTQGVTAVLVRPDGQIARVMPDLADARQLRGDFAGLTID